MNKDDIFQVWAPEESPWSPWVKPVLFAHLGLARGAAPQEARGLSWYPHTNEKVALVANLPGAEGVLAGFALAARGFRPIPLYNAVPLPCGEPILDPHKAIAAVDVLPILEALKDGTEKLAELKLAPDAPPAFLLDAGRQGDGNKMLPGEFDNRSVAFTTDFPSANFLSSQGIRRVILIQSDTIDIQSDLAHPLRRWQEGGLQLERLQLDHPMPEPFHIPRPSWYGAMFQRVLCQIGLRRWSAGGFGGWVPHSSAGG